MSIEIINTLGQVIYSGHSEAHDSHVRIHIQLDRSIANGMYLLNLRTGKSAGQYKFVVDQ